MYQIKQKPEDFVVEEIPEREWKDEGAHLVIKIVKKNWNTDDVVNTIAKQINVKPSSLAYAGTKDRNAVTTQFVSVRGGQKKWFEKVSVKDVDISVVGYSTDPLSLGSLAGNTFEIVVRNLDLGQRVKKSAYIPNLFGSQRFGKHNDEVGKAILLRDFEKACRLIIEDGSRQKEMLESILNEQAHNYIVALLQLPRKILMLYLHAYQSLLFNKELKKLLEEKSVEDLIGKTLPLYGFGTDEEESAVLAEEGLTTRNFIIRELPNMSVEGTRRDAVIKLKDLDIGEEEEDELNVGKKKRTVRFSLQKGSYATIVIEELFS